MKKLQNMITLAMLVLISLAGNYSASYSTARATPLQQSATKSTVEAVVTASSALNVRSGPGKQYAVVTTVKRGDKVQATERFGNCEWIQVTTAKGIEGWVAGGYVRLSAACTILPIHAEGTQHEEAESENSEEQSDAMPLPPIAMRWYQSEARPISFQYPADWQQGAPPVGITAVYRGEYVSLAVTEEDLIAAGAEEMSLAEYVDWVLYIVEDDATAHGQSFELLSRQQMINDQGLAIEVVEIAYGPKGTMRVKRLFYMHHNQFAFNVTYVGTKGKLLELEPVISYSFDTLQISDGVMIPKTDESPVEKLKGVSA